MFSVESKCHNPVQTTSITAVKVGLHACLVEYFNGFGDVTFQALAET